MNKDELNLAIGQRLREARKAQELSLAQLSERTGNTLSKSRISNYEQGIRRMGLEQAQALAQALGTVSPVHLLCLDDSAPELSTEEQRLVSHFRQLDATGRLRVLEEVAELAKAN
ncbi:helix-turn-helix domain-containing protein [Rhabdochromatium marinum]|uniref:helix-turn-helix domain-containing protein n=1 Tax=Rhabdochromatium marinum TaxID=48729 RepID=UPI00190865E0|nr:helix-turn-helix transcriptional regulator [Rhabdochromatium marinum]MBK1647149.1 transcriptional regulator [Rhabdochromatium marinum]